MKDNIKFSRCISAGTRVYYIDCIVDSKDHKFIEISEKPTKKTPGNKKRQQIFIHEGNIEAFAQAIAEVSNFIKYGKTN